MIITAIAMVAMLVMAAIVIDLGSTRAVRGQARATADAAAAAGADDLGSGGADSACATALGYAFTNLGGDQPTAAAITSSCSVMAGTCTAGTARAATLAVDGRSVQVTNPVPDGSRLLRATAVGGGSAQPADTSPAAIDGSECQRIGVEITQPQSRFLGGVASSGSNTFSIHSVARYRAGTGGGTFVPPAVVVLNQHTCKAIDTGSGSILVESTTAGPGIVYSDSDGTSPLCTGGDGILDTSGSGALRAAKSATGPGQLAWYSAPSTRGYVNGRSTLESGLTSSSYAYVGKLYAAEARTTRAPADKVYHCSVVPAAPCTTDPVRDSDALARAVTAPATFNPPPAGAACTTSGGAVTLTGNVFVDCDAFEVKGNPLIITGGANILFRGRLVVAAGGTLAVNVTSPSAPAVDAGGLPVPASAAAQTRLMVGSTAVDAIDINTSSGALYLAQTFVYSRGGYSQQALRELHWSPPSTGATKSLLYWSDAALPLAIQGGPNLRAAGVMFQGNGTLTGSGGGTIDLTNVQLWVDKVLLGGSTTVKLAPDPDNSIKVPGGPSPGSALIR